MQAPGQKIKSENFKTFKRLAKASFVAQLTPLRFCKPLPLKLSYVYLMKMYARWWIVGMSVIIYNCKSTCIDEGTV